MDFPLKPPKSWFSQPEADKPQSFTIQADGRASGHLHVWGQCHTGFLPECVGAPRSRSNYAAFHLGQLETAEGEIVHVGKVTYGAPHAPLGASLQAATEHYDHTGHVGAFVRASDGRHGIWLSGAVRSDISPEGLRDLRANPPSGDWRMLRRSLELVAALAVPVPGFPIELAASGDQVEAMVLPGYIDDYEEALVASAQTRSRSYLRERDAITASLERDADSREYEALVGRTFTAEERQRAAKSGAAMSDGSYPILSCDDWENARRAVGRTPSGKRAAVRAHIAKRGRALGCGSSSD